MVPGWQPRNSRSGGASISSGNGGLSPQTPSSGPSWAPRRPAARSCSRCPPGEGGWRGNEGRRLRGKEGRAAVDLRPKRIQRSSMQGRPRLPKHKAPLPPHLRYPPLPPLVPLHCLRELAGAGGSDVAQEARPAGTPGKQVHVAAVQLVLTAAGPRPRQTCAEPCWVRPQWRQHPPHQRALAPAPPTCRARFSASAVLRSRLCRSRSIFCHGICNVASSSKGKPQGSASWPLPGADPAMPGHAGWTTRHRAQRARPNL